MTEDSWSPAADVINHPITISIPHVGALRSVNEERMRVDRLESADGRINPTGHKLQRPREELVREWSGHTIGGVRLTNVFLDDRNAPADAKGPRRDLQTRGSLLALVFIQINFTDDIVHNRGGKSQCD